MERLLLTGRELEAIAPLCGAERREGAYILRRDGLEALYGRIKDLGAAAAARELGQPEELSAQLLPMLAIYRKILGLTKAEEIIAPCVDILDILSAQLLLPQRRREVEAVQQSGAVACARRTASARHVDLAHAERTAAFAVLLFDKLKKLHGISGKRRTLLECAALLHEVGEDVNSKNAADATYELIRRAYFYGLNEEETALVAEIAAFGSGDAFSGSVRPLNEKQRLLADKLAALLVLANALDESHVGKVGELKLRLDEKTLAITARGGGDMLLEKWAVGENTPFFEEVFGIRPVFVGKNRLL